MIPIQTTIVGYSGNPCSLFSIYDEESRILNISAESDYKRSRYKDCMVITNDQEIERDGLFSEDNLSDSISSFFTMQSGIASDEKSSRLIFSDKAARSNPIQSIEKDGVDANGQRYRIAESITCAQIATLATCWYANARYGTIEKALKMATDILDVETLNHGGFITI